MWILRCHFDELGAGLRIGDDFGAGDLAGAVEFFEEVLPVALDAGAGFFPLVARNVLDGENTILLDADLFGGGVFEVEGFEFFVGFGSGVGAIAGEFGVGVIGRGVREVTPHPNPVASQARHEFVPQ